MRSTYTNSRKRSPFERPEENQSSLVHESMFESWLNSLEPEQRKRFADMPDPEHINYHNDLWCVSGAGPLRQIVVEHRDAAAALFNYCDQLWAQAVELEKLEAERPIIARANRVGGTGKWIIEGEGPIDPIAVGHEKLDQAISMYVHHYAGQMHAARSSQEKAAKSDKAEA